MKQTALEYLMENLIAIPYSEQDFEYNNNCWNKAERIEKVQDSKRLLFVYKVSLIIGLEKTGELLKEVEQEIKHGI
jgi:hypothetical protein